LTHKDKQNGKTKNLGQFYSGQTLHGIIEGIKNILADENCELVPATMEEMAEEYRRTVPKTDIRKELKLDRRAWGKKK